MSTAQAPVCGHMPLVTLTVISETPVPRKRSLLKGRKCAGCLPRMGAQKGLRCARWPLLAAH